VADGREPVVKIILDSGAYSVWKLGKQINLPEYCDYIDRNRDWIAHYVNLDVINPGNPEAAAAASFENLVYMRSRGLDPMPVFHVGEDISWLYKMLDLGCRHIGLSASSLVSRNQVDDWYAHAWSYLVNSDGLPLVRVHAFGEARYKSLVKFPWASADSASWIYEAERAATMLLEDGRKVNMRRDGISLANAQYVGAMDDLDRGALNTLAATVGLKDLSLLDRCDTDSRALRLFIAALFYKAQVERINKKCPIRFHPPGFIKNVPRTDLSVIHLPEMEFYLVCGTNPLALAAIAFLGYRHVLASFFVIKQLKSSGYSSGYAADPISAIRADKSYAQYLVILEKYLEKR
jgi:hypothetical protein